MGVNLLAVDPGGRTGFVHYLDSKPFKVGEVEYQYIYQWLNTFADTHGEDLEVIVFEEYLVLPKKVGQGFDHRFQKVETLRVIGGLETIAARLGIPCVPQQSAIKPLSAKQNNLPYDPKKSGRGTHQMDAMLHGHWWLAKNAS